MAHLPIGIDLGTSTSEIAVFQHEVPAAIEDPLSKSPIMPSQISVNHAGRVLVGEEARDFVNLPGHGVREVKRKMGTGETITLAGKAYRPEELSALILRKLAQNAGVFLGEPVTDIVLSVPANFPDAARQATLHAAELAGLHVVRLINEPTAAALAFGVHHIEVNEQLVVFDFGGGTLDVSVLEMLEGVLDVRSSFGDPQLGGKDFDEALINLLLQRFTKQHGKLPITDFARNALKTAAERAKITLSETDNVEVFLPGFALRDETPVDLSITVTREEFEKATAPLLERAREVLTRALAAGNIRPDAVDRVLLVGGTTYLPAVRRLVAEFFGQEPAAAVDPDLAVVLGAATLAAMEAGVISPEEGLILTDISPFGIGFETMHSETFELYYSPLIAPNTPIPFTREYAFSLIHTDQQRVIFHLYQSYLSEPTPMRVATARKMLTDTGIEAEITDIPPSTTGVPHPVRVDFSYDENGVVLVKGSIPGLKHEVDITYQQTVTRMTREELDAAQQQMATLYAAMEEDLLPEELPAGDQESNLRYWLPIIARAERLTDAHPEAKPALTDGITALRAALETGDDDEIEETGNALIDMIDELEEEAEE